MLLLPKIILKIVFEKKNDFLFVDEAFYLVYVSSIIYTVDDCNMQMRFLDIGMQKSIKQVTQGHNIIADGWAGEPTPIHTQCFTETPFQHRLIHKKLQKRLFSCFLTHADGRTDQLTDRWMDKASYRVVCLQLKRINESHFYLVFHP